MTPTRHSAGLRPSLLRFIKDLAAPFMCRCFPRLEPASGRVAPMWLLEAEVSGVSSWPESKSPNPLSMPPSPRPRPSNSGTLWCQASVQDHPAGRKVLMLQDRTNAGRGTVRRTDRRASLSRGAGVACRGAQGRPQRGEAAARKSQTMKEYCHTFMEDYSKQRNKPCSSGYPFSRKAIAKGADGLIAVANGAGGHTGTKIASLHARRNWSAHVRIARQDRPR